MIKKYRFASNFFFFQKAQNSNKEIFVDRFHIKSTKNQPSLPGESARGASLRLLVLTNCAAADTGRPRVLLDAVLSASVGE